MTAAAVNIIIAVSAVKFVGTHTEINFVVAFSGYDILAVAAVILVFSAAEINDVFVGAHI